MKLSPEDWRSLRIPLLALGIALLVMGGLVAYTQIYAADSEKAMKAQESQLNQARQRYQSSGVEKETIEKYLPIYKRLIETGFIGEERRIEWVDTLRNIHRQQKLYSINYNIAAQEEYSPKFNISLGTGYTLKRSVMKFDLTMLHEADILTLLGALGAQDDTHYILRQCEIVRLPNKPKVKLAPSLTAKCELDWLTLHEPLQNGVAGGGQ